MTATTRARTAPRLTTTRPAGWLSWLLEADRRFRERLAMRALTDAQRRDMGLPPVAEAPPRLDETRIGR